jgi:hypothetical protein
MKHVVAARTGKPKRQIVGSSLITRMRVVEKSPDSEGLFWSGAEAESPWTEPRCFLLKYGGTWADIVCEKRYSRQATQPLCSCTSVRMVFPRRFEKAFA